MHILEDVSGPMDNDVNGFLENLNTCIRRCPKRRLNLSRSYI